MAKENKNAVKKLLKTYGVRPQKRLGQNFLIDKKVLKIIIGSADLSKNDTVLEIGPGIGTLTFEMAKKTKKIVAVEKDKKMFNILKELLKSTSIKNVKIINEDILKIKNSSLNRLLGTSNYKVVANIPYYITSPVIRKFLEMKNQPNRIILMVQKEVAKRICSSPPKMNLLAVSVQFYAVPKIISYVSKNSFWPQPKVDSAILKIVPHKTQLKKEVVKKFFKIVKAGFSHPRKQLINNLSKELGLEKEKIKKWLLESEINPTQRAETLSIKDWQNLTKKYYNKENEENKKNK